MKSESVTDSATVLPRVLIVDDNELMAKSLSKVLESAEYHTAQRFRGQDALEYVRSNACSAVLVDIHLPDISGLVVAQKMRDILGPSIPIIIVSGDTSMEVINALSQVGATYFFSKPLNVPYLLERMKEWIQPTPPVD